MERYSLIKPTGSASFAEALGSVLSGGGKELEENSVDGFSPVYVRFYLSDAQNQSESLRSALERFPLIKGKVSLVEQPPLDGSRICALVRCSDAG